MIPGQRRPDRAPGDLYLDPTVPADQRVTVSCGEWLAQATHVWTGQGWTRLGPGPVRSVPSAAAPPSIYVVAPCADQVAGEH
ncbi:hypothetical protein [Quadrisphaera sp. DSM 44207]|uniref:hypothetical protein n=1 Tax=Quadrisphaera sp. DSM 44207 TaxID=1881057 RepID=UPI0008914D6D|nr:hypothetical protein [Quadrisphaera sp. DSM 44207]SDQ72939.1 hypothetical protein SAMN05428996_2573 [Quadrisphaera sp. DSM 44207]